MIHEIFSGLLLGKAITTSSESEGRGDSPDTVNKKLEDKTKMSQTMNLTTEMFHKKTAK